MIILVALTYESNEPNSVKTHVIAPPKITLPRFALCSEHKHHLSDFPVTIERATSVASFAAGWFVALDFSINDADEAVRAEASEIPAETGLPVSRPYDCQRSA